jgi:hypothetical protein
VSERIEHGANGVVIRHWCTQSPMATMVVAICAIDDRYWLPLAPFEWRHIQLMVMWWSGSPF